MSDSNTQQLKSKRRILFFAEAVTLAHVARPMVLAQALDPQQYEVHVATDPRFAKLFPDVSLPQHKLESIPCRQFLNALAKGSPVYDAPTLRRYVEDDLDLIKQLKPDLVIGDFRLSLAASSKLANVPYATITNAYWSPYAKIKYTVPELPMTKILGVGLSQIIFDLIRPLAFALHTLPMNKVLRSYGLPTLGYDLREIYTHADHVLYADIPDLFKMVNLPSNHHFIGPVIWSPKVDPPPWWDHLPTDKPIVYVTPGSSGHSNLLEIVLKALADMPLTAIVATAGKPVPAKLSPNIFVADYLPGLEACRRASLVVCNGGSPTTHQALAAGKPVLAIPSNLDQFLNMQGICHSRSGELVRSNIVLLSKLQQCISKLIYESFYLHKAKLIADKFTSADLRHNISSTINKM